MDRAAGASLLFVNQHYLPDVAATGQCLVRVIDMRVPPLDNVLVELANALLVLVNQAAVVSQIDERADQGVPIAA